MEEPTQARADWRPYWLAPHPRHPRKKGAAGASTKATQPPLQKYYAVRRGRMVGIFRSWEECRRHVDGIYSEFIPRTKPVTTWLRAPKRCHRSR